MAGSKQEGIALVIVIIMAILFSILAVGVLFYARSSTEAAHYEVRKIKAYYTSEAALQRANYAVIIGTADGIYNWQISVGDQWIPVTYTITTNPDGTKTVTASTPNVSDIRLFFESS